MSRLGSKLEKGLFWSVVQVLVKRVFDFFVKLVLINILFPEDFGIIGIAAAITSIAYVVSDFGSQFALVQRKKEELFDIHFQSIFWWSLFWGVIVFLVIYFFATPFAARFFNEPQLLKIIPILSFPILINAFTLVFRVKMLRNLDFKKIGIINSLALIPSSFIGLIIALKGGGLWALVVYMLLPYVFSFPLFITLIPWKPKFIFSLKSLKQIFGFGVFTFSTSLIIILSLNINQLFIGKLINTKSLGVFSLAFMITILLSGQVTSMIDRVMFPFYSKIQTNIGAIRIYYLKNLQYYSLLLHPIMLSLMIFSSSIIKVFFTAKWMDAKTPIRILALVVLINLLTHSCYMVYRSIGKPKLEMSILALILVFITVPAVYIGSFYGIIGVSVGILVSASFNFLIALYFLNKELKVSIIDILVSLKPSIIAIVVTFVILTPLYLYTSIHYFILQALLLLIYGAIIRRFYEKEIKNLQKKYL